MRASRPLLSVLTAVLLAASVSAQSASTAPTTSDPQAVALLQKSLAALTGGAPVTDVTSTGSARRIAGSDNETGTATMEATSLGDSRVELSFASGNRVEIRNHSALPLPGFLPPKAPAAAAQTPQPVGEWIGADGSTHEMASHNTVTDADWFFPALTIARLLATQSYALSYIGSETHDGTTVLHVSAVELFPQLATSSTTASSLGQLMQHLSRMDFYFDPASSLPVALDFSQHPDNNALVDLPIEIRFLAYKPFNGVAVPTEVQKFMNYGLVLDLQFSGVALNAGLSSSIFALQ